MEGEKSKISASLRSESDRKGYYCAIGFLYGMLGEYEEALVYFDKFLSKCKDDPKHSRDVGLV